MRRISSRSWMWCREFCEVGFILYVAPAIGGEGPEGSLSIAEQGYSGASTSSSLTKRELRSILWPHLQCGLLALRNTNSSHLTR